MATMRKSKTTKRKSLASAKKKAKGMKARAAVKKSSRKKAPVKARAKAKKHAKVARKAKQKAVAVRRKPAQSPIKVPEQMPKPAAPAFHEQSKLNRKTLAEDLDLPGNDMEEDVLLEEEEETEEEFLDKPEDIADENDEYSGS